MFKKALLGLTAGALLFNASTALAAIMLLINKANTHLYSFVSNI